MHKSLVAAAVLASVVCAPSAFAQKPGPRGPDKFVLHRDQLGSAALGDAARARARRGDCAAALEGFDAAIRVSIDPTLRRDRGLCHERLGDTFPAIDDYRAYLTAQPDAADADDVRDRLQRLEQAGHLGGPRPVERVRVTSGGAQGGYDSVKAEENDDSGPLRRGRGWIVGPYLGVRRWFNADNNFAAQNWSEVVGIRVGYSLSRTSTLFGEAGYERFDSTDANAIVISGLSTQLAYEARLPFKESSMDNHWLFAIGIDYDQLFLNSSGLNLNLGSASFSGIGGQGRFGFRHNFGPGAGLEASIDVGAEQLISSGSSGSGTTAIFSGLNIALLFGLGGSSSSSTSY